MQLLYLLLLIAAVVCFAVAAFAASRTPRVNLVALGLAFFAAVPMLQTLVGFDA